MTPEVRQQWRGEAARWSHEAKRYAALAAQRRREAIECRKRRDFIGALVADCRAREYRDRRDRSAAAAAKVRRMLAGARA